SNLTQTASVELWGRKGYGGTNVAVKFDSGLTGGTELTSLTLSTGGLTGDITNYSLYFGVVDKAGNILASGTALNLNTNAGSITLSNFGLEKDDTFVWEEGYSLLMGFVSAAGSAWNTKSYISGIQVVAETVSIPEPATATLSLLALAGLAARRRRK
ncbi:MAG: PEP-CTERM sorting domain-containing protein, partial [Akkermansia sp.]|nr:PEP-CTERM sorting domain-containing protein [Akkermansia sp.]